MHPIFINAKTSIDARAKRFDVRAYTGGPLRLGGWDELVVVDLAKLKYGKSLIANLDHIATRRVGHIDNVQNDGRELRLSGALSAATEWRNEVLSSYQSGFVWQASIEANVDDGFELARGKSRQVNGQTVHGPLFIAYGTLKGVAFVSHGADDNTTVSIAAARVDHWRDKYDQQPGQVLSDFADGVRYATTTYAKRDYR